ncbi:hypothetical protein KIF53_20585 [Chromobacterium subtsugae]|uniref:Uncharacterized protein n=1 Tax=Chromobacterium subtsugae TaxID=251747 RepID=A0ABS7FJY8_9NEIS|nr:MULTISPECIES: DUF6058 family natural product biosynthesis protein [Chromobacterium]KUM01646.1 hypothetical protein Cv017_07100 [Chromobacterium subtsugae]KZE85325.1 hypothetical protein AWB61_20350 [Chromobacterium sp. F49]MBW7568899.1 hypothetical protein [Chromobacterium subtsugae]MBW8290041.1 hypothetical protein [Chromobacterium subtsugae]WSE92075.1 DUF6058 family natural product biosynthesis protein [Chromobacterium subtsugae]
MQALLDYLQSHFLSEPQLLFRCRSAPERLRELQQAGRMPLPSYRLSGSGMASSHFGERRMRGELAWYPRAMMEWLIEAEHADAAALRGRFDQRYRAELRCLASEGIAAESEAPLDEEWAHFLAGVYGACTRQGRIEQIAAKGAAIAVIDRLTDGQRLARVPAADIPLLWRAVDLLDAVSALFAPDEQAASSRARCVDAVKRKYLGEAA